MTFPRQWASYRIPPENAVRDADGYVIEPQEVVDESTWLGRRMKELCDGSRKSAEIQRAYGYAVYQGDPGKNPQLMSQHDSIQIFSAYPVWIRCSIL